MMGRYHSYTEGNGPFWIWGELGREPVRRDWIQLNRWGQALQLPEREDPLPMPKCDGSLYSDRLWQWDADKHTRLWAEHCSSGNWHMQTPEAVSAYLSAWLERPAKLVALWQYNHAMSGNPIWLLFYCHVEAPPAEPQSRGEG